MSMAKTLPMMKKEKPMPTNHKSPLNNDNAPRVIAINRTVLPGPQSHVPSKIKIANAGANVVDSYNREKNKKK